MQIIAKNLNYTYNKKDKFCVHALKNINLTIEDGSFLGIIGHTGSGKSTFIQHLNGIIPVQDGTLTIGDIQVTNNKKLNKNIDFKSLRKNVGMVFQYPEYQLFAETVFLDVAFGYKNFNPDATKEQIENAVKKALELVGLNYFDVKDKSPFELSGGQKRRVAIAGVLVTNPKILILDEPVAGLDPLGKKQLMNLLHSLHGTTCSTIIIVSHDMDEVSLNCDKVVMFSHGEIVAHGTTKEIFSQKDLLTSLQLDIPLTAKLADALKNVGVEIDTNYQTDDFINKIIEVANNKK